MNNDFIENKLDLNDLESVAGGNLSVNAVVVYARANQDIDAADGIGEVGDLRSDRALGLARHIKAGEIFKVYKNNEMNGYIFTDSEITACGIRGYMWIKLSDITILGETI